MSLDGKQQIGGRQRSDMELQLESWSYISWALWTFFLNDPITFWEEWILFCLLIWSETIGKRIQLKNTKKFRLRCNKVEKCKVYTLIIQTYKPKTSKHGRQTFPPKCSTNTLKILSNKKFCCHSWHISQLSTNWTGNLDNPQYISRSWSLHYFLATTLP